MSPEALFFAVTATPGLMVYLVLRIWKSLSRGSQASGWHTAARVCAVLGIFYLQLVAFNLGFLVGNVRGLAGQSLTEALHDQFVPFRASEVSVGSKPLAFLVLLTFLNLAIAVLPIKSSTKNNDANADTAKPPAD